jgi:hypothetical protein
MSRFMDCEGRIINIGDIIEHTGHGERYTVAQPGTEQWLPHHDGLILISHDGRHQAGYQLTELRASKARVVS